MNRFLLFLALAAAAGAGELPRVEFTLSATNLVVTESATATIDLYVGALPAPYGNEPPILNQRPPHVEAAFLEQDWKSPSLAAGNLNGLNAGVPRRGGTVRGFTLNNYVSNDIFSSMRDPFAIFDEDPFARLGPKRQVFPFAHTRTNENGRAVWRYTITTPSYRAIAPGETVFPAVKITLPLIASLDKRGRARLAERTLETAPVTLRVAAPPRAGRPAGYSGAIGTRLTATAALDTTVCTAGDPLLLTLDLAGDADFSRVTPPDLAAPLAAAGFRLDAASARSDTRDGGKSFTWRVRPLKTGTFDFPALSLGWYDTSARTYRTAVTQPLPIQAKAGAQAALAAATETEEEDASFPMPDGLDLDLDETDFTLKHALVLALRATDEKSFRTAADTYADFLAKRGRDRLFDAADLNPFDRTGEKRARHYRNLAALRLLGGDARAALRACRQAEWAAGETPATRRCVQAACARLRNDPRADLPVPRILFPFWYRFALAGRALIVLGALLALVLLFRLAAVSGRRTAVLFLAVGLAAGARGQGFFQRFNFGGGRTAPAVSGVLFTEPRTVLVGEPFAFILELETDKDAGLDDLRVGGLPDADADHITYGAFENLADKPAKNPKKVVKRLRLPARFLAPFSRRIDAVVNGMATVRTRTGFGSSSFSTSFGCPLPGLDLTVAPLPVAGRPAGYSGAIGRGFRLVYTLKPDRVRPGDLVEATCTLTFDGYFPTNAVPRFAPWPAGFKVYPLKETARDAHSVTWRRMLVPENVTATNAAAAAVDYYDLATKKYATLRAAPAPLVFVAAEAASTENTSVNINAQETPKTPVTADRSAATRPLELHFAPAATSPVVVKLPPGTPFGELPAGRHAPTGWRRVTTSRGTGWIRR